MKRVILAAALAASLVSTSASAMNGRDVYEASKHYTETGNNLDGAFYMGYVSAVADAMKDKLCFPSDSKYGRIAEVIKPYLKDHPELSSQPGTSVVYLALQQYYPCTGI